MPESVRGTTRSASRSAIRPVTAAVVAAVLVVAWLVLLEAATSPRPASADTAPVPGASPTVSADALPTAQIDGVVWKQLIVGNTVYVAGEFANARPAGAAPGTNLVPRAHMLAYDLRTGVMLPGFDPRFNAQVKDLDVSPDGSTLYAVGNFTTVDGQSRFRAAALSLPSGELTSWRPIVNTSLNAVAATATTVYLGGNQSTVNDTTRTKLAAVRASDASLLPLAATIPDGRVHDMALNADGSQLVIAGNFTSVNGSSNPGYGLARLDAVTGAMLPLPVNARVRNAGTNSAVLNVESDGTHFYGSGYHYHKGGNLEGTFSADWATGSLTWIEDCHGDTYAAYPVGDLVYQASHKHYCGNSGGFPQTTPWTYEHATVVTKAVAGTNTPDIYGYPDHPGTPRPEFRDWYPDWAVGSYTGLSQAVWAVAGNEDYVVYGGEFPRINNVPQEGLVRFARAGLAPNDMGPRDTSAKFVVTATSVAGGTVRVAWPGNADPDNAAITYRLYRGSTNLPPIATRTVRAHFWEMPPNSHLEHGLTPGSTQRYRVIAEDPFGNQAMSDWVEVTVSDGPPPSAYALEVLGDEPTGFWRLGETSGNQAIDWAGASPLTRQSGAVGGSESAILGDTDRSSQFSGSSSGLAHTTTAVLAPHAFSVEAWFKTSSLAGGKLLGFGSSRTGDSSTYDRHLYVDSLGRLVFGVYSGAVRTLNTLGPVRDGRWHHVVGTLSADGMALYVDGALVGRRTDTTSSQTYNGFWRVGGDNLSGWPSRPQSRYLAGLVDEVSVYGVALTPEQVARHHQLGTTGTAPNQAPTASFTAAASDLTVSVDGSGSSDADGSVAGYAWDFGDGSTGTGATASHTYADGGTYTVTLRVTDDDGAVSAPATRQVTVTPPPPNQPPVAAFTAETGGLSVRVDGSGSTDPDGSVTGYAWDFGDGATATGATASHTYADGGSYTVTLRVTDDDGATSAPVRREVTVTAPPDGTVAADSFERSVTDGWGSADVGGPWTTTGLASRYRVAGGAGEHSLPAGITTESGLAVSALDVDVTTTVAVDRLPAAGYVYAVVGARSAGTTSYAARLRVNPDGTLGAHLLRDGVPQVGSNIVPGLSTAVGQKTWVRFQVSGTAPATMRVKVWAAGQAEPAAWTYTRTDSSAANQSAGGLFLRSYAPNTGNNPVTLRYDDLRVVTVP